MFKQIGNNEKPRQKNYSNEAVQSRALGKAAYFLKDDRTLAKELVEARNIDLDNVYNNTRKKPDYPGNAHKFTCSPEDWDKITALKKEIRDLKKIANRW